MTPSFTGYTFNEKELLWGPGLGRMATAKIKTKENQGRAWHHEIILDLSQGVNLVLLLSLNTWRGYVHSSFLPDLGCSLSPCFRGLPGNHRYLTVTGLFLLRQGPPTRGLS